MCALFFNGGSMICEFCNGTTQKKKVKRQHWLNNKLYIIENVEAEVCLECGERYFHVKTLDAVDQILKRENKVKKRMDVEVVRMIG